MKIEEYLKSIGINVEGNFSNNNTYIIDLNSSDQYGRIYSTLEKSDDLDLMYDNQVVTEQGSSLIYESDSESYILNLIADFEGNKYQLIVNNIED